MPATGRSLKDFRLAAQDTPHQLYSGEERLLEAAKKGEVCQLGDEARGTPEEKLAEWNFVRASFVRFLALGGDVDHPVHESGVQLECAWIGEDGGDGESGLDLAGCKDVFPLSLRHCRICGDIVLNDACTRTIDLEGSVVNGGIEAKGALIRGTLYLRSLPEPTSEAGKGFVAEGGMNLVDATIKGSLECHNATFGPRKNKFGSENGTAIFASRAKILGSVFLQQTFSADGPTVFRDARIGGNFECSGGRFKNVTRDADGGFAGDGARAKRAIDCQGAEIGGGVSFRQRDKGSDGARFNAEGEICFVDAKIGGSFECHGARIVNPKGEALICSRVHVAGTVFLHEGFEARGTVSFTQAVIGGQLECSGGKFDGHETEKRDAIDCRGAKIGSSVYFRSNKKEQAYFKATGMIRFTDAEVGGSFECHGARIENAIGTALRCSRIRVSGSVLLIDDFVAEGKVSFRRADVGGHFDASYANISNMCGTALSCENIHVTGSVLLGLQSESSREAKKNGTAEKEQNEYFQALGEVDFSGAQIEGDFDGEGGSFVNLAPRQTGKDAFECDLALNLRSARIGGALRLGQTQGKPAINIQGSIDLRGTRVSVFINSEKTWPPKKVSGDLVPRECRDKCSAYKGKALPCYIYLNGFNYEYFGDRSPTEARIRRQWLMRQPSKDSQRPQPFEQLIKVLRAMGYAADATRIAIFRESLNSPSAFSLIPGRVLWWNIIVGFIFGYGYRLHRVLLIAVGFWLVCGFLYSDLYEAGYIRLACADCAKLEKNPPSELDFEKDCKASQRSLIKFNGHKYSADAMLPLISFGERIRWSFVKPQTRPEIKCDIPISVLGYKVRTLPAEWFILFEHLHTIEMVFGWLFGISLGIVLAQKIARE